MRKYEITRDQIIELALRSDKASIWLQQHFKDAFKNPLEVGKWYKSNIGTLAFYSGKERMFGVSSCGQWNDAIISKTGIESCCSGVWLVADESEILEALKKEAVKRGLVCGCFFKSASKGVPREQSLSDELYYYTDFLTDGWGFEIYQEGKWAEIIPAITKQEAEKELNCKIID